LSQIRICHSENLRKPQENKVIKLKKKLKSTKKAIQEPTSEFLKFFFFLGIRNFQSSEQLSTNLGKT